MSHRARLVTTTEGVFINVNDVKAALNDDAFVNEKIVPLLKVGHDRGDSPTKIVRIIAGAAFYELTGPHK